MSAEDSRRRPVVFRAGPRGTSEHGGARRWVGRAGAAVMTALAAVGLLAGGWALWTAFEPTSSTGGTPPIWMSPPSPGEAEPDSPRPDRVLPILRREVVPDRSPASGDLAPTTRAPGSESGSRRGKEGDRSGSDNGGSDNSGSDNGGSNNSGSGSEADRSGENDSGSGSGGDGSDDNSGSDDDSGSGSGGADDD